MGSNKQTLLEYTNTTTKPLGSSNTTNLIKAFPNAPMYTDYKDAAAKDIYLKLLNSESSDISDVIGYYGLSNFSFNYHENGAPSLEEVETGGGGLPATPYSPNIVSPGPGSSRATDQAEYSGETKNIDSINNFGTGLGGLVSPSETSVNISSSKLSGYISGKSFLGSDGIQ
jgi:hypothetical protein